MQNDPFESCRLKLGRAKVHCDTLENELRPWYKDDPCRIVKQYHPKTRRHVSTLKFNTGKEPQLERWSLLSADCIHNLRTALDHLIFGVAIVKSGQDPPPFEDKIQFPIADNSTKLGIAVERYKLGFLLGTPVWTAIESVQPEKRPNPIDARIPPLLSLIRDFENRDKHRLLHLVTGQAHRATIDELRLDTWINVSSLYIHFGSLKDGTEILSFTTDAPTPDVKYTTALVLAICARFGDGPNEFVEVCTLNSGLVAEVSNVIDIIIKAI